MSTQTEHHETIVIGGGQAGLSVAYHLRRLDRPCVVLDASARIGDAWRHRWDSLRLFTPARFDGLDGFPFPGDPDHFPTKDAFADHLEAYAHHFDLPVRTGVRVTRVRRDEDHYVVETTSGTLTADNVVVAMGTFQRPRIPAFGDQLSPTIVQLHSAAYRNPGQLQPGDVLLVGAGNSGSEVAMDVVRHHHVIMAGDSTGQIPFRIDRWFGRTLGVRFVVGFLFPHVLNVRTPVGRRARPHVLAHGGPLIRVKHRDLRAAGVERVPRVVGVRDGRPELADGRVLDVANVVWCTGFDPGLDWLDLPVHGDHEPRHESGVVPDHPGLYFVGLLFLDSLASEMINGVGRDARRIAEHLDRRMATARVRPASVSPWLPTGGA